MSIHTEIAGYTQEIVKQMKKQMERDLQELLNNGYKVDDLILCFYRDEPLKYSVRVEDKIILDRWLHIEFTTQKK